MMSTRASLGGAGENARAGTRNPGSNAKCRAPGPRPLDHLATAHAGTIKLALSRRLDEDVRRRSDAVVTANGMLATTLNGRRGRRRSLASAWTTMTR